MICNQRTSDVFSDSNGKLESLYIVAIIIHVSWCYFVANTEPFSVVLNVTEWLTSIYKPFGFRWSNNGSIVISAGIVSAFILNVGRRIAEGMIFGWPRFPAHDGNTCLRSWIRAAIYVAFVLFVIGAFGEKYSKPLDSLDVLLIAVGTFLLGIITNILDDAISATIVVLQRRKS